MIAALKPEYRWEALHFEASLQSLVNCRIDLCHGDGRVRFSKLLCRRSVLGRKFLAVSAPGCIELNQNLVVLRELLVEVFFCEDEHSVLLVDG